MDRKMTPYGNRIVLRMIAESRARPTGLILPDGARVRYDAPLVATVVDVGPEVADLQPGMEVLSLPNVDGVDVDIPGMGSFRVVGPRAVLAVLGEPRVTELSDGDLAREYVRIAGIIAQRIRTQTLATAEGEPAPIMVALTEARGGPPAQNVLHVGLN